MMRFSNPRGTAHPGARFRTPEEVVEVQKRLSAHDKSLRALAEEIGCSHGTLSKLKRGMTYREK